MAAGFAPRYTGLKISDMFLEIGSNVGSAARRDELGVAEITNWPVGDIETVNKQNMSLQA